MYIICTKIIFSYWTLYGDILYDVGKVLYKYCTSTFPISTLTIMFMCIMWWYIYEYHSCNCLVEINSIQFKKIQYYKHVESGLSTHRAHMYTIMYTVYYFKKSGEQFVFNIRRTT